MDRSCFFVGQADTEQPGAGAIVPLFGPGLTVQEPFQPYRVQVFPFQQDPVQRLKLLLPVLIRLLVLTLAVLAHEHASVPQGTLAAAPPWALQALRHGHFQYTRSQV